VLAHRACNASMSPNQMSLLAIAISILAAAISLAAVLAS
jgi:hypothetical protein